MKIEKVTHDNASALNWSQVEVGNIKLIHHSTASLIKIIITGEVQESQGGEYKKVEEDIWLEYDQFKNLVEAINVTQQDL